MEEEINKKKKKQKTKKYHNPGRVAIKIVAFLAAFLMVASMVGSLIFYLANM